jgi:hypothetical protein
MGERCARSERRGSVRSIGGQGGAFPARRGSALCVSVSKVHCTAIFLYLEQSRIVFLVRDRTFNTRRAQSHINQDTDTEPNSAQSSSLNLLAPIAAAPPLTIPTQSSQISTFTSPALPPPKRQEPAKRPEIIVLDLADSPVRPAPAKRTKSTTAATTADVLAALGKSRSADLIGSGSESDDVPLSLDFLLAPKVDKGKRRAGSEVAAVAQACTLRARFLETDADRFCSSSA